MLRFLAPRIHDLVDDRGHFNIIRLDMFLRTNLKSLSVDVTGAITFGATDDFAAQRLAVAIIGNQLFGGVMLVVFWSAGGGIPFVPFVPQPPLCLV